MAVANTLTASRVTRARGEVWKKAFQDSAGKGAQCTARCIAPYTPTRGGVGAAAAGPAAAAAAAAAATSPLILSDSLERKRKSGICPDGRRPPNSTLVPEGRGVVKLPPEAPLAIEVMRVRLWVLAAVFRTSLCSSGFETEPMVCMPSVRHSLVYSANVPPARLSLQDLV